MSTCRYCGETQIFDDHMCKKEIRPVAVCDHGILNWYDMECTNMRHDLYTADQLRQAKVEVLRAESKRLGDYCDDLGLLRTADEIEKSKT